jgi:hypothetical protein
VAAPPSPRAKNARGANVPPATPQDTAFREWFFEKRKHPAIQAIKQVSGYFPTRSRAVYEQLIQWLGDEPEIDKLEWAYGEWVEGKGGNPRKTLEWVKDGYVDGFYYEVENYLPKQETGQKWGEIGY